MLDWAHRLVLRSVARGDGDDSPALRDLVAAGLVAEREDGGYDITPAGRVALDAASTRPARWERIALVAGSVGLAILAIDAVAGWVT